MRRFLALIAGVVTFTLVAFAAPAASAAVTSHGTFFGGVGVNDGSGLEQLPAGEYPLNASGVWNISEGVNGVQVTGYFRVFAKGTACTAEVQPCPFMLPLTVGTPWTVVADGVFRSTFSTPLVLFTFTLSRVPGTQDVTLLVETPGPDSPACPHGWVQWTIPGRAST